MEKSQKISKIIKNPRTKTNFISIFIDENKTLCNNINAYYLKQRLFQKP